MTKFYKILNVTEYNNKLKIHEGLMEAKDNNYITFYDKKNIMFTCHRGPYIREVVIPTNTKVDKNYDNGLLELSSKKVIFKERKEWMELKTFEELINSGVDITVNYYYVFRYISRIGKLDLIEFINNKYNIDNETINVAMQRAASRNNVEIVKYFLKNGATANHNRSYAFRKAVAYNCFEVAELLLESGAEVNACNNEARIMAEKNNNVEMLTLINKWRGKH